MRVENVVRVLLAGGSLRLGGYAVDHAVQMASAARQGGGMLTIVHAYGADQMVQIAGAGKGHVTFDIVSKE